MAVSDGPQYPWYCVVNDGQLQQGDILLKCPVFLIPPEGAKATGGFTIRVEQQNVIVMTQSCDLAVREEGKCSVDDVILASVYFRKELENHSRFGKPSAWEEARKGRFPGYHVLNACSVAGCELDFMLVDLRRVFALSVEMVRTFALAEAKQRVRLLPPYREHLSQAFARFFMRVGLPVDIPKFT